MAQSLVDVSKLKDFDSKAAIDSLATSVTNVGSASAGVNQIILTGTATGVVPTIVVGTGTGAGADTNVSLSISTRGTGSILLGGTATTAGLQVVQVASAVNDVVVTPGATGTAPTISTGGSGVDANRDLLLSGNGTGAARIKGQTSGSASPVGYVGEVMGDMVFGTGATATVTITIAAPGVITWTAHGFSTAIPQPVVFTTTGALPTGITSGTVYYTVPSTVTTNTFSIATTIANAFAGTTITTSGSQSGTQTGTGGTAMANVTVIDVTGVNLTAGVWEVYGTINWNANAATTWTKLEASINTTTATLAAAGTVRGGAYQVLDQISAAATNGISSMNIGSAYFNVSVATTVFLSVKGAFATNTLGAFGNIFAVRIA